MTKGCNDYSSLLLPFSHPLPHFSKAHPSKKPRVAPILLAKKSSQSPLRLPPVQLACRISISPLINTGHSHTYSNMRRIPGKVRRERSVSIHITVHVPQYIAMWVHLSISGTLSSGVWGGVQKQSIHIRRIQTVESGYADNNLNLLFIISL